MERLRDKLVNLVERIAEKVNEDYDPRIAKIPIAIVGFVAYLLLIGIVLVITT